MGWFCNSAVENSATTSMCSHLTLLMMPGLHPFGYLLRSVIAESYRTSGFVCKGSVHFFPWGLPSFIYISPIVYPSSLSPASCNPAFIIFFTISPRPGKIVSKYSLGQIQNFLILNPRFSFTCFPKQIFHHTKRAHKLSKVSSKNCALLRSHRWSRVKCGIPLFKLLV